MPAIFHYVYAVLNHPEYCRRYASNLRHELPRIPFANEFWAFAHAGERLAELHLGYETQPEWPLGRQENANQPLSWRVEKMKITRDRQGVIYNDFLTLTGIPPEAFEYKLGNRSAIEWIVDQYQISQERRSGITNDPNRPDDREYVVRLIGQVVHVSVETRKIVLALPPLAATDRELSEKPVGVGTRKTYAVREPKARKVAEPGPSQVPRRKH